MPRRLPILPLVLATTVALFFLTSLLTAQPPAAQPASVTPSSSPGDGIKRTQEDNLKLYKRFAGELLKLAQRWEKSDNIDERTRAKTLRAALKIADEKGVENLFKSVLNGLAGLRTGPEFEDALAKDAALVAALKEVLETLETEDEAERIKREIEALKDLLKEAARIKREQETLRGRTNIPRSDADRIAKDQSKLADQTKNLANRLGGPKDAKDSKSGKGGKSGSDGPPKDDRSEPKPEAKPGDSDAEPKPETPTPKSGEKDPKDGMGGEPKGGEPKPSDGMKKDAGTSREAPKDGAGEPKSGKGMGEPKDGRSKDPKPMPPSTSKAPGTGKGDPKPSKGQGGEGKPMTSKGGMPSDSPPSDSKGSPGSPSDSPSSPSPPNPNNPNDFARRKVEEAVPDQRDAEQNLNKNKRDDATKNQDDAITKLTEAIKELEKRLRQLREKEMLKKLEDLERRVAKMLRLQIEVYEATKQIDGQIKKNNNQTTTANRQRASIEGEKEGEIVVEADRALRLLEGEGTAIVFAGILSLVRKDMDTIQQQLNRTEVGGDTQLIEEQVIAQLKQMLESLKKAKQDLQNPPPPPPPGMPPPSDQKKNLVQIIEQLKLLRLQQLQVNDRTIAFSKRSPGEQASDPFIQQQLRQLGDQQKFLQDMLQKVAELMNQE
jgi:hypothetical protein